MIAERRSQFLRKLEQHAGMIANTKLKEEQKIIARGDPAKFNKVPREQPSRPSLHSYAHSIEMVFALD